MAISGSRSCLVRFAPIAVILIASAGLCSAQEGSKDGDVLKGPDVKDGAAPGKNRKFAEKGGGGKGAYEQREVPMRQYARAFQILKADGKSGKVADGAALTVDQEEEITSLVKDYGSSVQAFRKDNDAEIKELVRVLPPEERRKVMAKLGELGGPGQGAGRGAGGPDAPKGKKPAKGERPDADGDAMNDGPRERASQAEIDAAMARLKELGAEAPKASDAQTKMWAVLNDQQKPLVKAELERMKVEAEKRRGERVGDGNGEGGPGAGMTPEMREKLKNMSPEERREAIQEFRKKRQAEGGGGDAPKKAKPSKKAPSEEAPGMDDVDVPDPE